MDKLKDKKVLITSGGQGIGLEIAREFILNKCDVAVSYLSSSGGADEIKRSAAEKQRRAKAFKADLTKPEQVKSFVKKAAEFLGGIDILVNNAGSLVDRRRLDEVDTDFWNKVMDINLTSMMLVTREALPYLRKNTGGASIVNLSSLAGRKGGHTGSLAYSTAKGAVLTWTRALATEFGPEGIRVNAVAPGLILGTSFHRTHTTRESAERTIAGIPIGRAGNPEDVARAIIFLGSEYDGFINGATIDINGGVYSV
jgi:3-oxoacyl-[acyl-carrier protein] reductase